MKVYIPSSGRAHKQTTVMSLPDSILEEAVLVVPREEHEDYHDAVGHRIHIESPDIPKGIGPTRQWCCDQEEKKVLMMDDDLVFAVRRAVDKTKFTEARRHQIPIAIREIETALDGFSHVGMATREGGNRFIEDWDYNTRLLRVLAYRTDLMRDNNIRFDSIPVMEDFYVSLSFLTNGFTNTKLNWMVQNQNGSGLDGGCSQYRTMEVQAEAAHTLHDRFPLFVKVVKKETKTAWGGGERTDVRISWKKALQWGLDHADS